MSGKILTIHYSLPTIHLLRSRADMQAIATPRQLHLPLSLAQAGLLGLVIRGVALGTTDAALE